MKIAVVTCWSYRDCWEPCLRLLNRYWPGAAEKTILATDTFQTGFVDRLRPLARGGFLEVGAHASWGRVVANAADLCSEPILMLQEDFFLNAPVLEEVIAVASDVVQNGEAGLVRLYPCPGATQTANDPYFGEVARGAPYRISCQASVWQPRFLKDIAARAKSPAEFEIEGTRWASYYASEKVLAFKRDVTPWPIQYICSAVTRGKWNPDALKLCAREGIEVDTSMRGVAA